ncbi:OpgC domain-containing protein [Bradyrhizobium jicamae]|uniref:OpgC domain-containing protein n=1 Tax=Bradyrhizobium jicamae TaxID=280332 RepID=A0ABS5FKQ1_9BRAD|nr:OpgC domain-containing protein [Bradyrhizobium jicamae]MBR0797365.1 OpgC domain-containing protein [Bradyrhizobium jicamae]
MANESKDLFVVERDLRLDLLRGLGLWMIFLDHIPDDVVSWLTLRNYGFSDAAEFFVFISGYLAGFIYVPIIAAGQFMPALKRLWNRVWHMYVAHILLFLFFTAQIARVARKWDNPMYKDEFNVANFLNHPDELIGKALTLQYKPVDLDVLPLYICLIAVSPFVLWLMLRRPNLTLAGSIVLYLFARYFGWNLPSYPKGATWYFNPFCWQLIFFAGAWCGCGAVKQISEILKSRIVFGIAIAWILFALFIVMGWHSEFLKSLVPPWLNKAIYPIDKTDLDMLRFTHFCALALVVSRYLDHDWAGLKSTLLRPLVLCGQHSLPLFCLGVFLSFGAHWVLVQWKSAFIEQFVVSFAGFAIMTAAAWLLDRAERVPNLFVDVEQAPGTKPSAA